VDSGSSSRKGREVLVLLRRLHRLGRGVGHRQQVVLAGEGEDVLLAVDEVEEVADLLAVAVLLERGHPVGDAHRGLGLAVYGPASRPCRT
jgi:hypothetical protein